jgi:hypothetical protein
METINSSNDSALTVLIKRNYYARGTNGTLYIDGRFCCHTIELPWIHNERGSSCIAEGAYPLVERFSLRHGHHLQVMNVYKRDMILFHPANDARKELKGCIAPVTAFYGMGKGIESRKAFRGLMQQLYPAFTQHREVWLHIISQP